MHNKANKTAKNAVYAAALAPICAATFLAQSAFAESDSDASYVEGPNVKWQVALWGTRRAFSEGIEALSDYVSKRTNGDFDIDLVYGQALASTNETIDGLQMGAYQAAAFCPMYTPSKTPVLGGLDLANLPVNNLEQSFQLAEKYYERPEVKNELSRWNAVPLLAVGMPSYEIMGRGEKPLDLADWEGMKVHAGGGLGKVLEDFGVSVSVFTAPDLFQALERGIIDAAAFPYTYAFAAYRLHEVSDWVTDWSLGAPFCHMVASAAAHDSLPDQYRELLIEAKAYAYEQQISAYHEADRENEKAFEAAGIEKVKLTDEIDEALLAAAKPYWNSWAESVTNDNVDGQELLNFILDEADKLTE